MWLKEVYDKNKIQVRLFEYLSFIGLLILPKCSLCLFAISSTITICGVKSIETPIWEYGMILLAGLFPLTQLFCGCSIRNKIPQFLLMMTGSLIVILYAFLSAMQLWQYYAGIVLLALGYLWTVVQKLLKKYP
jgi:hypothetical protein